MNDLMDPPVGTTPTDMTAGERRVLNYLNDLQARHPDKPVQVSYNKLAVKLKLHVRTLQRIVQRLEEDGYIERIKETETGPFSKGNLPNKYLVHSAY